MRCVQRQHPRSVWWTGIQFNGEVIGPLWSTEGGATWVVSKRGTLFLVHPLFPLLTERFSTRLQPFSPPQRSQLDRPRRQVWRSFFQHIPETLDLPDVLPQLNALAARLRNGLGVRFCQMIEFDLQIWATKQFPDYSPEPDLSTRRRIFATDRRFPKF